MGERWHGAGNHIGKTARKACDCQMLCINEPFCQFWVHNNYSISCWLYTDWESVSVYNNSGYTSGPKYGMNFSNSHSLYDCYTSINNLERQFIHFNYIFLFLDARPPPYTPRDTEYSGRTRIGKVYLTHSRTKLIMIYTLLDM